MAALCPNGGRLDDGRRFPEAALRSSEPSRTGRLVDDPSLLITVIANCTDPDVLVFTMLEERGYEGEHKEKARAELSLSTDDASGGHSNPLALHFEFFEPFKPKFWTVLRVE